MPETMNRDAAALLLEGIEGMRKAHERKATEASQAHDYAAARDHQFLAVGYESAGLMVVEALPRIIMEARR